MRVKKHFILYAEQHFPEEYWLCFLQQRYNAMHSC